MTRDIAALLKMDERNWGMTVSLCNVTRRKLWNAMTSVSQRLHRMLWRIYNSQCRWRQNDNDNPGIRHNGNVYSIESLSSPARAHLSEPSAIPGLLCHAFLLQGVGPLYTRKWLGTTVTHSWRLTRLRRRPPRRVREPRIYDWEVPARAKTRAGISAAVKSIFRNDGVRIRAFTSSDAVKYGTQNRARQVHSHERSIGSVWYPRITLSVNAEYPFPSVSVMLL